MTSDYLNATGSYAIPRAAYRAYGMRIFSIRWRGKRETILVDNDAIVCYVATKSGFQLTHDALRKHDAEALQDYFGAVCEHYGSDTPSDTIVTYLGFGIFPPKLVRDR